MPRWPNSAVAARNASVCVRPVVCAVGGPMCAPITSGGINIEAPRWIVWRSRASLQSLVQTRSVRRRIPRSMRAPPDEQLSISTSGCAAPQLVEQSIQRERLAWCRPRRRRRCPATWSRFMSHLTKAMSWSREQGVERVERSSRTHRGWRDRARVGDGRAPVRSRRSTSAQSGWARYRSLSGLTISGSTQMPNSMPSAAHVIDQRPQPVGVHRPARPTSHRDPSCRRGGRRTNRRRARTARPRPSAAASASAQRRSMSWSKYTASHVLSSTGRGRRRMTRAARGAMAVEPPGGGADRRRSGRRRPRASSTTRPARGRPRRGGAARRAERAPAIGQPLGEHLVVAAPRRGGRPTPRRCHSPNPPCPANSSGGFSCDVRPRRFSARNAPSATVGDADGTPCTSARGTSAARRRTAAGQG